MFDAMTDVFRDAAMGTYMFQKENSWGGALIPPSRMLQHHLLITLPGNTLA